MKKRIFSTLLLVILTSFLVAKFKGAGCIALLISGAFLTQLEFYKLMQKCEQRPFMRLGIVCGLILMLNVYFCPIVNFGSMLALLIIAVLMRALLLHSVEDIKKSAPSTIFGLIYIPFMTCFPIELFSIFQKKCHFDEVAYISTLFWIIIVAKCCDIGGMFAGKYFGKHKLMPNLSPKKTVEGFIGGILLSNIVGICLKIKFHNFLPIGSFFKTIILSTALAVLSLAGDLIESTIKRAAGEKDSGRILPGIGGIFDLTDSLILALPFGTIFLIHFGL